MSFAIGSIVHISGYDGSVSVYAKGSEGNAEPRTVLALATLVTGHDEQGRPVLAPQPLFLFEGQLVTPAQHVATYGAESIVSIR